MCDVSVCRGRIVNVIRVVTIVIMYLCIHKTYMYVIDAIHISTKRVVQKYKIRKMSNLFAVFRYKEKIYICMS